MPSRPRSIESPGMVICLRKEATALILSIVQRVPSIPKQEGSRRTRWSRASLAEEASGYSGGKRRLAPPTLTDFQPLDPLLLKAIDPLVDGIRSTRTKESLLGYLVGELP